MAVNFGQKEIKALYKGNQPIKQVYKGTELIYPTGPDFPILQDLPLKIEAYRSNEGYNSLAGQVKMNGKLTLYHYIDESLTDEVAVSVAYGASVIVYQSNNNYANSTILKNNLTIKGAYRPDRGGYVCHVYFDIPDDTFGSPQYSGANDYDLGAATISVRVTENNNKLNSQILESVYQDKELVNLKGEDMVIYPYNEYDGAGASNGFYVLIPEKYFDSNGEMTNYYISFCLNMDKVVQKTVKVSLNKVYDGNTNIQMYIQNFINIPSWNLDISNVSIYLDAEIENNDTAENMGNFSLQYNTYGESISESNRYSEPTYVGEGDFSMTCLGLADFHVTGPYFGDYYFSTDTKGVEYVDRYVFMWDFLSVIG